MLYSCGGNKLPIVEQGYTSNFVQKKAYVVIRSEGGPENVQRVRDILAADFSQNNVQTEYSLYRAKERWNQNEIFNTAYKGQYDYIVLIDQVAKFTIDSKTQVGGKYQIRSYHVKSPNPNWLDLGQSTFNISVVPSVQKFSREVIRSIVGNQAAFKGHDFKYNESIVSNETTNSDINNVESSKDLTLEIERLRKELEEEKQRTRLAEQERQRLENKLKLEVEAQEQRARIAQIEAEDAALIKRQRQREIAERYTAKSEEIKRREAEEARKKSAIAGTTSKKLSRQEIRTLREENKRRIEEEKEAKRLVVAQAAEAQKQERRRLEELEAQEKRRIKEELEAQRKLKERLAEEDIKRIKEKAAQERRQAEELDRQRKEAERLAEQKKEQAKRQAELREAELKEQAIIEKQRVEALAAQQRKAKRIAREEEAKRQEALLKIQREEEKRLAKQRLAELERQEQLRLAEENNRKSTSTNNTASSTKLIEPNVFVIMKGKDADRKHFEDLQDYIEFDFMFAKAKLEVAFFSPNQSTSMANVLPRVSEAYNMIILVDQQEYLEDGSYKYDIMRMKNQTDNNWKDASSETYNLNVKADLKRLSKKITEYLSN